MVSYSDFFIKSRDSVDIYISEFRPENTNSKTLIITHGYGEHQGYYHDMASYFVKHGFNVFTYDLRLYGKSTGKKGDIKSFDLFVSDLNEIISFARGKYPDNQIFLFGHSMGGSITLNYLLKNTDNKITAAVISSPWLKLAFEPPKMKKILADIGLLLFPGLVIKGELHIDELSRSKEFIERFKNDPLNYDKLSARYYNETQKAGLWALESADKLKTPCLITHGDSDKITSAVASQEFAAKAGNICKFKLWSGGYKHVVFSEGEKEDVFRYYLEYLLS